MKQGLAIVGVFLVLLALATQTQAQERVTPCTIEVETVVIQPVGGKNGSVEFKFKEPNRDYKIFLINQGAEQAREPLKERQISRLKSGFYDFLITDNKGCTKQLTITLK